MKIKVISSSKSIFESDSVIDVYAPTSNGNIGILKDHVNLLSTLDIGLLRVNLGEEVKTIVLNGGFVQVKDDEIMILADEADLSENLVKEEIQTAIELAQDKLSSSQLLPSELIQLEKKLRYERFKMNQTENI